MKAIGLDPQAPFHPLSGSQENPSPPRKEVQPRPTRLLLLSDVHANWEALQAVLEDAQGRYEAIQFLGDVVGYGPRPVECVRWLRECMGRRRWSAGNHDLYLLGRWVHGANPAQNMVQTVTDHRSVLEGSPGGLWSWLQKNRVREEPVVRRVSGAFLIFAHANLHNPVDYLYPDDTLNLLHNLEEARKRTGPQFDSKPCWLVVGHTHMVCLARMQPDLTAGVELLPIFYGEEIDISNGVYLINPGSVGQPRDGDWRASYAILDTDRKTVEFRRVGYKVRDVQIEMQHRGYPHDLVATLYSASPPVTHHFEAVYQRMSDEGVQPLP